ncbi:hypothetical protein D0Z07_6055 [Hyphodiscus hymeniophilus]|uniref:PEX14-like helix-turn-helix domain-containing protein n=1 Tax=Hyphodiscus hymeniophilus TaxID=353542 RepID=A0A9P6VH51_9HELO|nr:hypothetical protein D0Z07_6055 [Hyphodiscus hymeniophilus]
MSSETVSVSDDPSVFHVLETYPWDQDGEYQIGLRAILGPATDASQIHELTLRAQVFYLARKKNIPIDFDAYKAYLASKPDDYYEPSLNSISASNKPISLSEVTEAGTETEASQAPLHQLRRPSGSQIPSVPLSISPNDASPNSATDTNVSPPTPPQRPTPRPSPRLWPS